MAVNRLVSLIRKEFIQIGRDPRTLAIALFIPIMLMFLLGYAATNDVKNVRLVVYDQDRGPAACSLLDAFRSTGYFSIAYFVDSEVELRRLIDNGKAKTGIIIPPRYSDYILDNNQANVAFIIDGTDPTVASTVLSAAQMIGQAHETQIQTERLQRLGQSALYKNSLVIRTQVWYNPDLDDAYFMVPGLIGIILYTITSILTANAIVRERERGTIEQLIVTPIRPWELVVGKIAPYVIIAFANTAETLVIGSWWFRVPVRSNLGIIAVVSGLFLLSSLGIGLLASTIASTQQESMMGVYMTALPAIFLSGFFFPLEAMPKALQLISYALPTRYYLRIIRSLMLKGVGVVSLQEDIIALLIFGMILMTVAALRFRKRLD
jgi:ABC-2 type transport system permease protein